MDLDWCLTCERRVPPSTNYCSEECTPAPAVVHHLLAVDELDEDDEYPTSWPGNDAAGISAWAADIPNGPPPHDDAASLYSCASSTYRPPLRSTPRIAPPTLCTSSTQSNTPGPLATPIVTPRQTAAQSAYAASLSKTSLKSTLTESSLATPASSSHPMPIAFPSRKSSMLGDMYTHVRSWVSPTPHVVVPPTERYDFRPPLNPVDSKFDSTTASRRSQYRYEPTGRSRLPSELHKDDHPSFIARGRKASRAAA